MMLMLTVQLVLLLAASAEDVPSILAQRNQPPEAHFYGIDKPIPEDTPIGTVVFYVNASDPDGPSSALRLQLNSNSFYLLSNGSVVLQQRLNYELETETSFNLIVYDSTSSTPYSKIIQVSDVNDVKPRFSKPRYQTHLAEDTEVGTQLFNVTVTDEDIENDILSVECITNSASPTACDTFRVEKTNANDRLWEGKIYLKKPLDYEEGPKLYQLLLQAKDGNDEHNTPMTFEITVDDVPDSPPFFAGSFNQVINEDVAIGTYVITVIAKDRDTESRPIRYELSDNPGGFFAIDAVSGNITTAKLLDRENHAEHDGIVSLVVTAREVMQNGSLGNDVYTKSSANVKITIIDVNDNPPVFEQTHYSVNVSEALQNGQALPGLLMSVSDADVGNNAFFKFVFTSLKDYGDVFEVSPPEAQGSATATLLVKNSTALDYDRGQREYALEVIAKEVRTATPLSSTAVVTVYLMDANDNKPRFDVPKIDLNDVSELTASGEDIAMLPKATDIDTGLYGTAGIRYSLIGSGNNRFVLNPLTARLRLADCSTPGTGNCLDHEAVTQYNLSLVAIDNNGTGHETRLPLYIRIRDENDNLPQFTSNIYQYKVVEETTQLTTNQPISATDRDSSLNGNNRIRYSLVTDRESIFTIDTVTGQLSLKRPIQFTDGDENGRIRVTVSAGNKLDDSDVVDYTRTAIVDVYVQDINNNAPEFNRNYTATIQENIRPGVEIIRVKADDKDYGQNAALEYSIVSGSQDSFEIDSTTGVITRKHGAVISHELMSTYNLTVRATDKGYPRLSGETRVYINVLDDSNRNPFFSPPTRYANVSEDEAIDFLVTSMQAIDIDDSADLRYSFIEPMTAYNLLGQRVDVYDYDYRDLFRIDSKTGEVRVNKKLDITKVQKIIYTVEAIDIGATDGPEQRGTGTLTIDIINANNNAPEFAGFDGDNYVYEEEAPGSLVMVLSARDADRNLVKYEILNQTLPGAFAIDEYTGIVTVNQRIDYESVQSVIITVRASDDTPPIKYTDKQFTVNVRNINDNLPVFSRPYYEAEISENTTERQHVVTVAAVDNDLPPYGEVRYRFPVDIAEFRIDETTGAIYKEPDVVFDREKIKEIQIAVEAYDGPGNPSRSSFAPVYIKIKDLNDNWPYFMEDDIYIVLSDDHQVGAFVLRQTAVDLDSDDSITYSIRNDAVGRYAISPEGVVTTCKSLSTSPDHVFDIVATDKAQHSAVLHVHVTVVGNKKGPVWVFPRYDGDKIIVCENREAGFTINDERPVEAERAIEYGFYVNNMWSQDLGDVFRIHKSSGLITIKRRLDREQQDKYLVQVIAKDGNDLVSQRYLLIEVCDSNDNQPEFPHHPNGTVKSLYFTIEEDVIDCVRDPSRYNECGRVQAFDLDIGDNARIVYKLSSGDTTSFTIDEHSGVISTRRGLDITVQDLYILTVMANNYKIQNGQVAVLPNESPRGMVTVYIQVLPRNSATGAFINKEVNMYAYLDTQIGQCLDTMRPKGVTASVKYRVQSTPSLYDGQRPVQEADGEERFSVGEDHGYVCTINLFNPNYGGYNYVIKVEATTSDGEKDTGTANVWLTENKHKIRIVVNGDVSYVNSNRLQILDALRDILGTKIVWIDSVGRYTSESGQTDSSKSDVIIYAVNETTRQLMVRNSSTIEIINKYINEHKTVALSSRILRAEDIHITYIYLKAAPQPAVAKQVVATGTAFFPAGLLAAMILLLPLLLLPFLLACCLCCPCCAALLGGGGKKSKYVFVEAPGYQQATFIDDWYEQSRMYNNPAYADYDENWDTGSDHMLVMNVNQKNGAAAAANGGGNVQTVEETEEFYNHMNGGGSLHQSNGQVRNGSAGLAAGEARMMTDGGNFNTMKSSATAETAVIVDGLAPGSASAPAAEEEEAIVVEERYESQLAERLNSQHAAAAAGSANNLGHLDTAHSGKHSSSLSPGTLDALDTASSYNAHMANRQATLPPRASSATGHFSHTAVVNRHGTMPRPSRDGYYSAESYESEHYSDGRRRREPTPSRHSRHESAVRYDDDSSMTIILDADRTPGMEVEAAEYQVIADEDRPVRDYSVMNASYHAGGGTIPRGRGGFTIELEPHSNGRDDMEAEHEEYVLTDDDGLAPEFFAEAPRSPTARRRYKKTMTTRSYHD